MDGYKDHKLSDVWEYINSHEDRFDSAQLITLENGAAAIDVYPAVDSVVESELREELEESTDIKLKPVEAKYCVNCIRFAKR